MGIFRKRKTEASSSIAVGSDDPDGDLPTAGAKLPAEAFSAVPHRTRSAGTGVALVHDLRRGLVVELPTEAAAVLDSLDAMRETEEHIEAFANSGWEDDGSGLLLESLAELGTKGLLYARSSFIADLAESAGRLGEPGAERGEPGPGLGEPGGRGARIGSLCWVTRSRPASLERSMESFIDNCERHGREAVYKVCDDSPSPEERERYRSMLGALSRGRGVEIEYYGREEKAGLASRIAESAKGVPRRLIDFALFGPEEALGPTHGANRNASLLVNAGSAFLSSDDDILCRPRRPRGYESDLLTVSSDRPVERIFPYASIEAMLRPDSEVDVCLLEEHERLLGRSLASAMLEAARPGRRLDIGGLRLDAMRELAEGSPPLRLTSAGSYGDLGHDRPRYFFSLLAPGMRELARDRGEYRLARSSRSVHRGSPALAVDLRGQLLTGMQLGIDCRAPPPPFFPVFRGEDTLFGAAWAVLGGAVPSIGRLPLLLLHEPEGPRSLEPESFLLEPCDATATLLGLFRSAWAPLAPGAPPRSMASLGRALAGLGSLPEGELRDLVMAIHLEAWASLDGEARSLAASGDWPEYFVDDFLRYAAALREACLSEDFLGAGGRTLGYARLGSLLLDYGSLMEAWPGIFEAAEEASAGSASRIAP
ncbi:MAG TPA: hypothetical protein VMV90_08355 [Rectinemataceae bacterium]|nr:hypothetical protein [Rectinemataceae bacterium]